MEYTGYIIDLEVLTMKKIYILFTETNSILSRSIQLYTRKKYNHTSISFTADLIDVYSFGRKKPRNPFLGGFTNEDVSAGLFRDANCLVYSLTITEAEWYSMNAYVDSMNARKEIYTYNLIGLVAAAGQFPIERENAFFCSQFVATVLSESNRITFDKPLSLISPADLEDSLDLEFVYEGPLQSYLKMNAMASMTVHI